VVALNPTRVAAAEYKRGWLAILATVCLVAVTAFLRFFELGRSYDVFIDEATYVQVAQNLLSGKGVSLYGQPFYVHPPFFFLLEAAFLRVMPVDSTNLITAILHMRALNAGAAVICVGLLFYIGYRVQGWWGGLIAGGLFALDPFASLVNSEVLLETTTLLWALIGLALLVGPLSQGPTVTIGDPDPASAATARGFWGRLRSPPGASAWIPVSWHWVALAGLAFGLSLVTDQFAFFVTILPLALCFGFGCGLPRCQLATIAGVSMLVYGVYVVVSWHVGLLGLLGNEQWTGFLRLIGRLQLTGFNRPGAPSFFSTAIADLPILGPSYTLMLAGFLTIGALLARPSRQAWALDRVLGMWCAGGSALVLFVLIFHGTLEEQMFYYLTIPSVLAIGVIAPRAVRHLGAHLGWTAACVPIAVVALLLAAGGIGWYGVHSTQDNGYQRATQWLATHVAAGTTVSVTDQLNQVLIEGYPIGSWVTPTQLIQHHVRYVVISSAEVDEGYAFADRQFARWLEDEGQVVYAFVEPTYGRIAIYSLTPPY
jgi:hypothetical protein